MTDDQASEVLELVRARLPSEYHLPFELWSVAAISALLISKFELALSASSVRRYMARWGLPGKAFQNKADEAEIIGVHLWIDTDYPEYVAEARRERATIYWCYPIERRAQSFMVASSGRGDVAWMSCKGGLTVPVVKDFLLALVSHSSRRPYVLLGPPMEANVGQPVRKWADEHADLLIVRFAYNAAAVRSVQIGIRKPSR